MIAILSLTMLPVLLATAEQSTHDWRTSGADPCACTDAMPYIIGPLPPADTEVRVVALVAESRSSSCRTSRLAVEALRAASSFPDATVALTNALTSPACAIRATAAWSLVKHPSSAQLSASLTRLLDDPDRRVQQAAAYALGMHGGTESIAPLIAKLDSPSKHVRQTAAQTLGTLRATGAESALARLLASDPEAHVREAAEHALRRIRR